MTEAYKGTTIVSTLFGIITVGIVIALMVTGGGLLIPFLKIPWYIWAFGLLLLVLWLFKK